MCQISSLIAAAEGPVAEFSSFANFEEKKRKSNLLMSFPKTGSEELHLSYYTIETYRKRLISKLSVRSSVGLVVKANEMGLLE